MKITTTQLKILSACMLLAQQAYALEAIQDRELGQVTGQDGITLTHEVSKVTIDQANWFDPTSDSNVQRGLGLHNVQILGQDQNPIQSKISLDVAKTDRGTGIRLDASIDPFMAQSDLNIVEKTCTATGCSAINRTGEQKISSLGQLGIFTRSPISVFLQTKAGLFNRDESAFLQLQLQNATIRHSLAGAATSLHDFNFNFSGAGYMYIDPLEGIVLSTYNTPAKPAMGSDTKMVNLGRVRDYSDVHSSRGNNATNPGVNIDLRYTNAQGVDKNIMRMGASGDVTNAKIIMNGDQSKIKQFGVNTKGAVYNSISGYEKITDTGGLHLGMSADFTQAKNSQLSPTTFEIGHTGKGSYAIEFSDIRALTKQQNAYIDFGDIYINTISGQSLDFLVNENLRATLMQDNHLLKQNLSSTNNYALIAVRGMDFQAIASKARFIADNSLAALTNDNSTWGLGIPIYNLNANVALTDATYNTDKQGIAYNIIASTEGYGVDAKTKLPSTTSFILIDGAKGVHDEAVNYYAGFRNIDALIQSNGVIGYEDDGIYVRADQLLLAAKAELAIGQLPGSKYNCKTGSALCGSLVANDSFAKPNDVLTSIALKLDGSGEIRILPGTDPTTANPDSNFLSLKGNFKFKTLSSAQLANESYAGSYISFINEDVAANGSVVQNSAYNFNKLQGHLGFDARVKLNKDTVSLDSKVDLNYKKDLATPFRTNFAMTTNNTTQNIASIALTGGSIRSNLGITPR
jgi:hypothetical protein